MQIFCRSIRPDGYGEGVVPGMEQPIFDYDFPPDGPSDAMLESAYDDFDLRVKRWYDHINSLPVLYLIHPDLAKVGFIGEHKERYEAFMYDGEWLIVEKWEYDNASPQYRRIVMVPVEGKAEEKPTPPTSRVYNGWNENKSRVAGIGGQPGPFERKAEEKEVVDEDEAKEDERILDAAKTDTHVRDWFDKWSEITKINGGGLITTSIRELLTDFYNDHKPTPVIGDAVEWQLCPKCNGQGIVSKPPWIAGDVHQWLSSFTADSHQCDVCNGAKLISKLQAASRPSDAVEEIERLKGLLEELFIDKWRVDRTPTNKSLSELLREFKQKHNL